MSDLLRLRPSSTPEMLETYSDNAVIAHALAFESALALAQAAEGLITAEQADAIVAGCALLHVDNDDLSHDVALAGTLAIPLVKRLKASLPADIAMLTHVGATSQDVADTVMILQAKQAWTLIATDVGRLMSALKAVARSYSDKPATGRTLLQDAMPLTLGLRVAHWHTGIAEAMSRLDSDMENFARLGSVAKIGGSQR